MITLKHLAREFDLDPFKLRRMLRAEYGTTETRRWRWQEGDVELTKVRTWLKDTVGLSPLIQAAQAGHRGSAST
jgi:hypothetical protein